eukprot:gene8442-9308_t
MQSEAMDRSRLSRIRKSQLEEVRHLGHSQGKVLHHIMRHCDKVLREEMRSQERKAKHDHVQTLRHETLRQQSARSARLSNKNSPKSPAPVAKHTLHFHRAPHREERKARAMTANLPLAFLRYRREDDLSQSSEVSRALGAYEAVVRDRPNLRYHLPFTNSFAERGDRRHKQEEKHEEEEEEEDDDDGIKLSQEMMDSILDSKRVTIGGSEEREAKAVETEWSTEEILRQLSSSLTLQVTASTSHEEPGLHFLQQSYSPRMVTDYLSLCEHLQKIDSPKKSPYHGTSR